MLHIKKTTLKDLKTEAEDLRRKEYMERFGPIKGHVKVNEEIIDREIDDFI